MISVYRRSLPNIHQRPDSFHLVGREVPHRQRLNYHTLPHSISAYCCGSCDVVGDTLLPIYAMMQQRVAIRLYEFDTGKAFQWSRKWPLCWSGLDSSVTMVTPHPQHNIYSQSPSLIPPPADANDLLYYILLLPLVIQRTWAIMGEMDYQVVLAGEMVLLITGETGYACCFLYTVILNFKNCYDPRLDGRCQLCSSSGNITLQGGLIERGIENEDNSTCK